MRDNLLGLLKKDPFIWDTLYAWFVRKSNKKLLNGQHLQDAEIYYACYKQYLLILLKGIFYTICTLCNKMLYNFTFLFEKKHHENIYSLK